jgi:hypothetical protein
VSKNPRSVNYKPLGAPDGSDRAARRAALVARATEASTGQAGADEGDRAKDRVEDGRGVK